jgi:hypothetical protein
MRKDDPWEVWFAWVPVYINYGSKDRWTWLTTVARRRVNGWHATSILYEYAPAHYAITQPTIDWID